MANIINKGTFEHYLYYDETSPSSLRWKVSKGSRAKKDAVAGSVRTDGYWVIRLNKVLYLVHRVVYVLHYSTIEDTKVINHKDNDPSNNTLSNLGECTYSQNSSRTKMHTGNGLRIDNISGITGISEIDNGSGNLYARVLWSINKTPHKKLFSYTKLGKENAWKEAILFKNSLVL